MKPAKYILDWYTNPSRRKGQVGKPTLVNFPITDNCNSRCVMCNVWQEKVQNEIGVEEIRAYFSDSAFSEVEHVGISGGEPTLRKDLVECIEAIVNSVDRLRSLSVTSHGYHVHRWRRFIQPISEVCLSQGVEFVLNLSLDGIGESHNVIRGTDTAFERVCNTLELAMGSSARVQLQCTVSRLNVYGIGRVLRFARAKGVEVIFRCATRIERLDNNEIVSDFFLTAPERSFLADFFLAPELHEQTRSPGRRLYYLSMARWLVKGGDRPMPCYFQNEGVLITSTAEVFPCSVSDKKLGDLRKSNPASIITDASALSRRGKVKHEDCKSCIHDQSGAWSPGLLIRDRLRQLRVYNLAPKLQKAVKSGFFIAISMINNILPAAPAREGRSALVVGAYGGEHVGDAAILGGVLLRLERTYGIDRCTIASFRPDRTQMWADQLNTPVDITVVDATMGEVGRQLKSHAYLAYAGGPLMELPAHLSRHLHTFSRARRHGLTRIVEGVGIGPLHTNISKWCVRQLLKISDSISIRQDLTVAESTLQTRIFASQVRDPAFDYLERITLDRARGGKLASDVDKIVSRTGTNVAINLRPLWSKYSTLDASRTADIESDFLDALADAMFRLHDDEPGTRFIFFPMNPDQFGFSDLLSAYDLEERLSAMRPGVIDYKVWEAEPDPESILYLLDSVDAVLAMRFHACIFSMLRQSSCLIGVDYQIGGTGKVSGLFRDEGASEQCLRVDLATSDQIYNGVKRAISSNSIAKDGRDAPVKLENSIESIRII